MLKQKFQEINKHSSIKASQETQKFIKDYINFGYDTNEAILQDLNDEVNELKDELLINNIDRIKSELGDVVFVLCNLSNKYGLNLEDTLKLSNDEFQRRFLYIENKVGEKEFKSLKISKILELWKEAKGHKE